jgi:hypothetical protein
MNESCAMNSSFPVASCNPSRFQGVPIELLGEAPLRDDVAPQQVMISLSVARHF